MTTSRVEIRRVAADGKRGRVGLGLVAGVFVLRSFKAALGIPTGEVLGVSWAWLTVAVAVSPAAVADGAAFPLACRMLVVTDGGRHPAARAYTFNAVGSVVGGLLFLVPFVHARSALVIAALLCLVSAGSALGLTLAWGGPAGYRRLAFGSAVGAALAAVVLVPYWLEPWSARLQWHDHVLVETARSPYATIAVVRAADQFTFFVNGSPSVTVPHPAPEVEVLAHFPMLLHDRPARVLVIGGGAGGLLGELLRHPVEEVAYAEQDPLLIEMLRRFPTPLTAQELTHNKVRLHFAEGRLFLRHGKGRWDVILLNLPAPLTLMLNRYYTEEFFALARSRLSDGGLLAFVLPGSETLLSPELAALNGSVHAALRMAFGHVGILAGDPNLFLAWDSEVLPLIFAFMTCTGGMVGAQFPVLVASCALHGTGLGFVAGRIYALDLLGAVLGAALAGVALVPTIGIAGTILLALAMKVGSVILILAAPR